MDLLANPLELEAWRRREPLRPVHFVPTMGALHEGHRQLLRRARHPRAAGPVPRVLLSIFVNPLQFGPTEDFARYPRDPSGDAALARAEGVDALFLPAVDMVFPGGEAAITRVRPPQRLLASLCGRSRPGHFEGVATVVCRLLALVRPARLLLGEKDWQQLQVLRQVVADLGLPVAIEGCATVRRADGLACSSRNRYLASDQQRQALALPAALAAAQRLRQSGVSEPEALREAARQVLAAAGLAIDYLELVGADSFRPLRSLDATDRSDGLPLLAAAVQCGPSRLIDHVFLMTRSPIVAIDGPAGAGKSTVTRELARRLGLIYLDTGAMYRAVTWWVQRHGGDPGDAAAVAPLLEGLDLRLQASEAGEQQVRINGHEVSQAIRAPEVTAAVSQLAALPCVREALTRQQQMLGRHGGLVAEGRDIGTAVFPDADCKVFLTASVAERARRRAEDLRQRGFAVPLLAELEASIAARDHQDASRAVAPLRQAEDAVELVTDGLGIEAVLDALLDLVRRRIPEDAWPGPAAAGATTEDTTAAAGPAAAGES
ncbi:MAG: bifunctional pantoate--beta-alanine ligase/(d)CMP kinase [Synechococcaceae cyanobacterium]|nr:bifunctional pantoate--beta-alanine ligase/(d)CMP kinase [Synechococcaceae cyanobacterium]